MSAAAPLDEKAARALASRSPVLQQGLRLGEVRELRDGWFFALSSDDPREERRQSRRGGAKRRFVGTYLGRREDQRCERGAARLRADLGRCIDDRLDVPIEGEESGVFSRRGRLPRVWRC